jgi:large subunit ribosomal protein L25
LDIIKLKTRTRTGSGKSYARKARADGWIPAVYYGHNLASQAIEVNAKEFGTIARKKQLTHLVDLGLDGEKESIAVIKDIQRHILKAETFIHIDFQHVEMDEPVTVECPVVFEGTPVGVKIGGGVLGHPVRSIRIECLPQSIPEKITLNVAALDIGDSIHVRDISVPNVTIKESPEEVLAVVTSPTRGGAETETPEGEEGGEAAS